MPDFNFAKGSGKRKTASSADPGRIPKTPQKGTPARDSRTGASDALQSAPEPAPGQQPPQRSATADTGGHGASVLDNYPERDLSHLTEHDTENAATDGDTDYVQTKSSDNDTYPDDNAVNTSGGEASPPSGTEGEVRSGSGKGPLIAFLSIIVILLLIAFIWHVNPWPELRNRIASFFGLPESGEVRSDDSVAETTVPPAGSGDMTTLRSWDFFVQVSSWKELAKADLDAERYRAQGFDVIVESEFIPAKGGTWYRVRLGPYESSTAASTMLASAAGMIPGGAYVDSVRLDQDLPVAAVDPVNETRDASPDGDRASASDRRSASHVRIPGHEFEVIDEPLNGWAVKVSSLKNVDHARQEARKLIAQGYAPFITRSHVGGATWYRVMVGPFSSKDDADRYQQLLNVTYGNDAYTIDLSRY
ncbi:MAG: SPOR domain-containing protein [Bacteroidetes bacterium]|nr:SPOR domain-containing protein [Bacteroidota bacterium]